MNALRERFANRLRPMQFIDLKQVLAIEKRAYEFAWSEGVLRDCIQVGYQCWVLEVPHSVIQGYGIMSVAAGEAHILNLCVRPELQGRGLSGQILDHLLAVASAMDSQTVFLEVRPSNRPALWLYAGAGFCEVGLRRGYYPATTGREDALVLAKELNTGRSF
jgi:ribosomal-protein-alanine N-acetyltransferase